MVDATTIEIGDFLKFKKMKTHISFFIDICIN